MLDEMATIGRDPATFRFIHYSMLIPGPSRAEALPLVDGVPQQDLRLGPCVGSIGKFICIGLNYADHADEASDVGD